MTLGEALQALDEDELVKSALPGEMHARVRALQARRVGALLLRGLATGTSRSTSTSCRKSRAGTARTGRCPRRAADRGGGDARRGGRRQRPRAASSGPGTYGHADPAAGRPVDAHTLFQIGSISKSFTAICLLRQWERGRLDLDAEVRTLLPWFPFDGITVHHLLSHTGGIVCSLGDPPSPAWRGAVAGRDRPRARRRALLVLERRLPGARARARAADRRAVRRHVPARDHRAARPGRDRAAARRTSLRPRLAVGHEPLDDDRGRGGSATRSSPATWVEYRGADGSVCATVGRPGRATGGCFLNDGAGVLSAGGLARMATPVAEDPDDGWWYGYGVSLRDGRRAALDRPQRRHVGYHAQLWCDLDAGLCGRGGRERQDGGDAARRARAARSRWATNLAEPDARRPRRAGRRGRRSTPSRPIEWRPICGLYRSHNPWATTLVVGTRGGPPIAIHWGDAWPLDAARRTAASGWAPRLEPGAAALRHAARRPLHARLARGDRVPPARVKYVRSDIGGGPEPPVAFTPQPRSPSGIAASRPERLSVCAELQESSIGTARRTSAAT